MMTGQNHSVPGRPVRRWIMTLTAVAALSGCAVYAPPPYAVYGAVPAVQPYYYGPYAYGRPAYVGPPLSLNFGYYQHRYHGNNGWRGHGWGRGHGGFGGRGGYHGGGRSHR